MIAGTTIQLPSDIIGISATTIRAYLLTILLVQVIPEARVIYSDCLDEYPAYYMLLKLAGSKVIPVELGQDYEAARIAVDGVRQIYYTNV